MKTVRLISVLVLFVGAAFADEGARAPQTTPTTPTTSAILPQQFAGWQISGSAQMSKDPAVADSVNAALLREYGFTDFESVTYTRDDGRKLTDPETVPPAQTDSRP